jgi:hypothetical protein
MEDAADLVGGGAALGEDPADAAVGRVRSFQHRGSQQPAPQDGKDEYPPLFRLVGDRNNPWEANVGDVTRSRMSGCLKPRLPVPSSTSSGWCCGASAR